MAAVEDVQRDVKRLETAWTSISRRVESLAASVDDPREISTVCRAAAEGLAAWIQMAAIIADKLTGVADKLDAGPGGEV